MGLTLGSLFSGIGGFDEGFRRAGIDAAWQVEIDPDAQRVLRGRFDSGLQLERGLGTGTTGRYRSDPEGGERTWHPERASDPPVIHADVTGVGAHNLAAVDVVCGGFPCQDLSVAGKRAGLAGSRSGLWFEFHRILAELAPRWVVIENVPGLLSSNGGADMAVVLGGLGELGYGWAYRVLDAQYFGVAQRRRRVFIVGCLGDGAAAAQVLFEPESCDGDSPPSRAPRESPAGTLGGGAGQRGWAPDTDRMTFVPDIYTDVSKSNWKPSEGTWLAAHEAKDAHTLIAATLSSGGHPNSNAPGRRNEDDVNLITHTLKAEGFDASEDGTGRGVPLLTVAPAVRSNFYGDHAGDEGRLIANASAAVRRLTPTECERLQGFPDGWTEGHSDSARYRMLGNAVCVPVAEWIGRRIAAYEEAPNG